MKNEPLNIVILGLSITSSWGNGHATTFRGLVRQLAANGHTVTFLERDVPWYASHRDLPAPTWCSTHLYNSLEELYDGYTVLVQQADLVIVGSYVPEGVPVSRHVLKHATGVTAFYDIDTPVTIAKLQHGDYEYLSPELIPQFDLYLSFTGGPTLQRLERQFGSPMARALYCSFDPQLYYPEQQEKIYDLAYLGTYSNDRQPPLQQLMFDAAAALHEMKFAVAGPQYPAGIQWPANIEYIPHLPPAQHRSFYNSQRFTLNITRADMVQAGYSPSVRLFEAAACGVPIVSDYWPGLTTLFEEGTEILIARSSADTIRFITGVGEEERTQIGERARKKVLLEHTAAHRANQLENYYSEALHYKNRTATPAIQV